MSGRDVLKGGRWRVVRSDALKAMNALPDASADCCVTDPPYSLSFMQRSWDSHASPREFQDWCETWAREALRVLKPGGHLLAFGGTRTYHRLACAVEDAGFEIRDSLMWIQGSGFPKSLDVSKAIDRGAGVEREDVYDDREPVTGNEVYGEGLGRSVVERRPVTPQAQQWEGWGTALKPSYEPVVVARKPLVGTVARNVLEFGTGALNVDGCRIASGGPSPSEQRRESARRSGNAPGRPGEYRDTLEDRTSPERYMEGRPGEALGRWPANVVLSHADGCVETGTRKVRGDKGSTRVANALGRINDDGWVPSQEGTPIGFAGPDGLEEVSAWSCVEGCPVAELDRQSGDRPGAVSDGSRGAGMLGTDTFAIHDRPQAPGYGDRGGASRFFYTAKSSSAERNAGLDGFEEQRKPDGMHSIPSRECNVCGVRTKKPGLPWPTCGHEDWRWVEVREGRHHGQMRNVHPTVKPLDVMRWLVRLVTPPNGLILDPFAGSGTTGCAAALEGFRFLGVEREAEYVPIAEARVWWWSQWPVGLSTAECLRRDAQRRGVEVEAEERRREREGAGQLDILSLLEGEDAA